MNADELHSSRPGDLIVGEDGWIVTVVRERDEYEIQFNGSSWTCDSVLVHDVVHGLLVASATSNTHAIFRSIAAAEVYMVVDLLACRREGRGM